MQIGGQGPGLTGWPPSARTQPGDVIADPMAFVSPLTVSPDDDARSWAYEL